MDPRRRKYAQDDQSYNSRGPGLPRSVKPQRSLADVSARSPAPRRQWNAAPPLPQSSRRHEPSRQVEMPDRRSRASLSSASSRGSSMFSRQEQAYESSTSVDEASMKPSKRDWNNPQRRQRPSRLSLDDDTSANNELMPTTEGYGATLWNRVASAANTLTINVSKAWAAGLFSDDGEVTPTGGESRLTLALKNYHLSKAKTASDLPSWLFSEEERRVRRNAYSSREEQPTETNVRASRQRGLKSIYADAVSDPSMSDNAPMYTRDGPHAGPGPGSRFNPPVTQSKATSRLQAMRDARRPTAPVRDEMASGAHAVGLDNGYEAQLRQQQEAEMPRRIGLPRGPKQRLN